MMLPRFGFVTVHGRALDDGPAAEDEWSARAVATGRAAAHVWHATPGLIVPRQYTRLPGWAEASRRHAVHVRASGGGVVPQGPGVLNLSLVWPAAANAPVVLDAVYAALCSELAAALARLDLRAVPQPVQGSFCDGRYNLAVAGRKLAGTAQAWRRSGGRTVVLAHAALVTIGDPQALTEQANAFERDVGSDRRYRADALTSVALAWREGHPGAVAADLDARVAHLLGEQFARMIAPHEAQ
ncbi:MAG: lipoate--protein ligase [Proteobacteria bacterium]|jgi:lipoate-protein ligase A|nr:lipoate--protein ligase [Pseudomonadota bacterium]